MAKPSLAYLLSRLEELQRQIAEYQDVQRFGLDDFPVETILMWRRVYGPESRRRNKYTFTAIKRDAQYWQLSSGIKVTWASLCEEYFPLAEDGKVYHADKFSPIF